MNEPMQSIQELTALGPELQLRIVGSALVILVLGVVRAVVIRVMRQRIEDARSQYRWGKTISYTISAFGIFIIGRIWFEGIQSLAAFLGLVAAGVAVALRDPIVNLADCLFIIWRRPFVVGDRAAIAGHRAGRARAGRTHGGGR